MTLSAFAAAQPGARVCLRVAREHEDAHGNVDTAAIT